MPESLLIYKKKEKSTFKMPAFLTLFPILFILGLVYGGLFFYENQLNDKNQKVLASIEDLKAKRRIKEEDEVKVFDKQLNGLNEILGNLAYTSSFFDVLEMIILPKTSLKSAFVNLEDNSAIIGGYVSSYKELSEQIAVFLASKDVVSEEVVKIGSDTEGFINFEFNLVFKPEVFKK